MLMMMMMMIDDGYGYDDDDQHCVVVRFLHTLELQVHGGRGYRRVVVVGHVRVWVSVWMQISTARRLVALGGKSAKQTLATPLAEW
jgi:hypothetical protein